MQSWLARLAFVFVATIAGASCLSPTLPLPPPEPDEIRASTTPGHWFVGGRTNEPNAEVVIRVNDAAGPSTTSDAQRRYIVEVVANLCDSATIQEIDPLNSELSSTTFYVQPTTNGFPDNTCTTGQ